MLRSRKEEIVGDLKESFHHSMIVVAEHRNLTVAESNVLRKKIRETGGGFRVAKNNLIRIAVRGTDAEALEPHFSGGTSIGFSDDPVGVAKVIHEAVVGTGKLTIRCGLLDGKLLAPEEVEQLAKLPDLDTVRARLVATLQAPASNLVRLLTTPGTRIAQVLQAKAAGS